MLVPLPKYGCFALFGPNSALFGPNSTKAETKIDFARP
jgi:hypothetical protein